MENKVITAGTKIVIHTYACVGAKDCTAYILERDYTERELDDISWQEGIQFAETYGIYPPYEDMDDGDEYSEDIDGYWELYDSKNHDDLLIFGFNQGFNFHSL